LLGGTRSDLPAFVQPTILTDLNPEISYYEEIFGPVASSTESSMKKQQ
jgi:acyl-CoA reductase-like NAD-dependent aldehyde dehydrogenase